MFANDGILSKRLVLILIRVYQQRSAWHCADTDFINNKKCKWKIWQERKIFKATDSCKSSMNFQNVIKFELWLYSLLSKLAVHFTAVLTAIMSMIYLLPVRNQICFPKNLDHKHYKEQWVHSFSGTSGPYFSLSIGLVLLSLLFLGSKNCCLYLLI